MQRMLQLTTLQGQGYVQEYSHTGSSLRYPTIENLIRINIPCHAVQFGINHLGIKNL